MGSKWNLCIKHSSLFFGKMVYNEKLAVDKKFGDVAEWRRQR
jgi:hypothetical protein